MPASFKPRLAWLAAAAALAVGGAWWLSALGHSPPRWLARALVLAAFVLVAIPLISTARGLWTGAGLLTRIEGRLLLVLTALALTLSLVGIGHEIGGLYFADEGVFLAQAQRINQGQLLKGWFVYPHLLFYLDAFALWLASLFSPVVTAAARLLYGVEGDLYVASLVTRAVTATLAGSTVVPVFLIACRLAGTTAAALAGALLAISPIYLEIGNLNLGDVPAAFFATVALAFVAALADEESTRGYLGAGVAAGLAAGSKYPAGTVAVAIAAVWVFWRLRHRRRVEPGPRPLASQPLGLALGGARRARGLPGFHAQPARLSGGRGRRRHGRALRRPALRPARLAGRGARQQPPLLRRRARLQLRPPGPPAGRERPVFRRPRQAPAPRLDAALPRLLPRSAGGDEDRRAPQFVACAAHPLRRAGGGRRGLDRTPASACERSRAGHRSAGWP